jgi:hypothetical protein
MMNAVSYALITGAAVAAAKTGMPHLLAPYVAMLNHTAHMVAQVGR